MSTTVKYLQILVITAGFFFCCIGNGVAQSFYSQRGLGTINYFVSGQSVGMGGVGLAVSDRLTVNYLNPAALVSLPATFISGNFRHEGTNLKGQQQDGSLSRTNVAGVQFHLPLKREKISFAIALLPFSTVEYQFQGLGSIGNDGFTETVSGAGGLNTASVSLAVRPWPKLSLGASGLFYFGNVRNVWRVAFASGTKLNTTQEVNQNLNAAGIRFGLQWQVTNGWRVGGVFSPSTTLQVDRTVLLGTFAQFNDFLDRDLEVPTSYGMGTSLLLGKKLLIGADYYLQRWSNFGSDGLVNDSRRFAVGVEYSGRGRTVNSSWFSRSAVRAGFYIRDLGLEDPIGESVTEAFGTLGVGFPLRWTAARIDLALEVGQRGSLSSNPIRENVIRFTGSITAGEAWFFRGRR